MKGRSSLLAGACLALVLGGAPVIGLPQAVCAQNPVVDPGVWIGIKTDTARVFIPASGETTLVIRVTGIEQGGPAARGGVLLGDVLVALNGRELPDYEVWLTSLAALGPGQEAHLRLNRRGIEVETLVVVADERPPSFAALLDVPERDAAWEAMRREFEALLETLPDTFGPGLEVLSATIRGIIELDSGSVSFMLSDTSMTLDIQRAERTLSRVGPTPVRGEPGTTGRLEPPDRDPPAEGSAAGAEAARTTTPDSGVYLFARGDSILAEYGLAPLPPSRMLPAEVALLSSVVLGGAQVRTLSGALGRYFGVSSGVLIIDVLADSPARRAGFRPGDVIVALEDRGLATLDQLRSDLALAELPISVTVIRHGELIELTYPVR